MAAASFLGTQKSRDPCFRVFVATVHPKNLTLPLRSPELVGGQYRKPSKSYVFFCSPLLPYKPYTSFARNFGTLFPAPRHQQVDAGGSEDARKALIRIPEEVSVGFLLDRTAAALQSLIWLSEIPVLSKGFMETGVDWKRGHQQEVKRLILLCA